MNLKFEYVKSLNTIRKKYPGIICKFCLMPFINPAVCSECLDMACEKCLTENLCCPSAQQILSNKSGTDEFFNGKGANGKILENLEVYCPNKINGCRWLGKRSDYYAHYIKSECPYVHKNDDFFYTIANYAVSFFEKKFWSSEDKNQFIDVVISHIPTEYKEKIDTLDNDSKNNLINNFKSSYVYEPPVMDKKTADRLLNLIDSFGKEEKEKKKEKNVEIVSENHLQINFNNIESIGSFELLTHNQKYLPKQTGHILLVSVGGGGGSGAGGSQYEGGGGSGFVEACIVNVINAVPFDIIIGKGGKGGAGKKEERDDTYNKYVSTSPTITAESYPEDGYSTQIRCDGELLLSAKGGEGTRNRNSPNMRGNMQILGTGVGGNGFSGGGNMGAKGGSNGSHGYNYRGQNYIPQSSIDYDKNLIRQGRHIVDFGKVHNGIGSNSTIINSLNTIYQSITPGPGGIGVNQNHGGGGAGGLKISNVDIKASDGKGKNGATGGIGFGAGGGGGSDELSEYKSCTCTQYTIISHDGGSGADGCVIIGYINYRS